VDAIATPFVQGHLRGQPFSVVIDTTCAHCGEPITLEVSSDPHRPLPAGGNGVTGSQMAGRVLTPGAKPMIFSPMVDFGQLRDPSIIDAF
jgi:hypothetical protein